MENTKSQKKSYSTASSKSRARRKTKTDYYDYSLVAVIVLLTCFGLIMLYSTSSLYGSDKLRKRHVLFLKNRPSSAWHVLSWH